MIFFTLFFNILLYITLILIDETTSFSEENSGNDTNLPTAYRLPKHIIPYHYDVKIEIFLYYRIAELTLVFANCYIFVKIHRPTYSISFHSPKPPININFLSLKNNTFVRKKRKRFIPLRNRTYDSKSHILTCYFAKEIPKGDYKFHINYWTVLIIGDNIFKNVNNTIKNKRWFHAMHFQPIGARQIFPCWDEPEFKANFDILIRHRREYRTISNNNFTIITYLDKEAIHWTYFNVTPKISTYHVGFFMVPDKWFKILFYLYRDFSDTPIKIHLWNRYEWRFYFQETLIFARRVIVKVLKTFKNHWISLERISEMQFVIIPSFSHNYLEKWNYIIFKEQDVIYDENEDPLSHKIMSTNLITHRITHQYIGNLVSPSWWSHHWLNQGLATLLGIDIHNKSFPDFRMPDLFVVQMQQESLRLDGYSIMEPLITEINTPTEIISLFSFSFYIKAPAILRMLQCVLSDEIFKKGIEEFYKTYMFRSATVDNFYDIMQTIYDAEKESYMEHFIIKDMMDAWTKQKHYPILKVNIIKPYKLINASYSILMEIENYDSLDLEYIWWMPITVTKQTELNFTISTIWHAHKALWLDISQPEHVFYYIHDFSVEENEWYIINLQQMGYYRVNYGENNWRNIARYLNSINYTNIHVLNRAQIIDDAYHFMMKGTLNLFIFMELVEYLSHETDYVAWYPMFKALEDISRTFPFPKGKVNFFKAKILSSLHRVLQLINYEKKSNEKSDDLVNCLRQEASKWACDLGSSICWKEAETRLYLHFKDYENNTISLWQRHWTFCNGLRTNKIMWNKALRMHHNNSALIKISSKFLACSNNPNIINNYINILFHEFNIRGKYNHLNDIFYIISKHANNNEILDNILWNLNIIPRKYIIILFINIINHVYSEEQLNKIEIFVDIFKKRITIPIITSTTTHISRYSLIINKINIRRLEISIPYAPFSYYTKI